MNMLPGVISQKIRKKLKTRENKQDNFDFTRKMSVCYLTENLEKFVKFVKLEMTILISRKKLFSFLLAEIPYRKFMFFYALRNEFLRLGTEFHRFLFSQELNFLEKSGKYSSWELNFPVFSKKRVSSVPD